MLSFRSNEGDPADAAGALTAMLMVALLLARGAEVNTKDGAGDTPLDDAKRYKHTKRVAQLLKRYGAKPRPSAARR